VEIPRQRLPKHIEMIDDDMVAIMRAKTGVERLAIAYQMYSGAWRMLRAHLQSEHPDWDQKRLELEVARRLSHGAI
jgi:hypothetical protein